VCCVCALVDNVKFNFEIIEHEQHIVNIFIFIGENFLKVDVGRQRGAFKIYKSINF
jgi:hypothetical protein